MNVFDFCSHIGIKRLGIIVFFVILFSYISYIPQIFASTTNGTIDATNRYAWGENIGWIDFDATSSAVTVTDAGLTGYVYGENIGWISLNCSNTSSCGTVNYGVANNGQGTLSGYAWSENTGWINFAPTNGGVSISSSGVFSGYAYGENIGWINFSVTNPVTTDWRPSSVRLTSQGCGTSYVTIGNSVYATKCGITSVVGASSVHYGAGYVSTVSSTTSVSTSTPTTPIATTTQSTSLTTSTTLVTTDPPSSPPSTSVCLLGELFNTQTGVSCTSTSSTPTPSIATNTSPVWIFTQNLQFGNHNAKVKLLQEYLNTHGSPVTQSGPGSSGNETTTFGYATKAALIKFQKANGIAPAEGYFGLITRNFIMNTQS